MLLCFLLFYFFIFRYVGDGLVMLAALIGIGAAYRGSRPIMAGVRIIKIKIK